MLQLLVIERNVIHMIGDIVQIWDENEWNGCRMNASRLPCWRVGGESRSGEASEWKSRCRNGFYRGNLSAATVISIPPVARSRHAHTESSPPYLTVCTRLVAVSSSPPTWKNHFGLTVNILRCRIPKLRNLDITRKSPIESPIEYLSPINRIPILILDCYSLLTEIVMKLLDTSRYIKVHLQKAYSNSYMRSEIPWADDIRFIWQASNFTTSAWT